MERRLPPDTVLLALAVGVVVGVLLLVLALHALVIGDEQGVRAAARSAIVAATAVA